MDFSYIDSILSDDTILLADGRWRPRKDKVELALVAARSSGGALGAEKVIISSSLGVAITFSSNVL